MLEPALSVVIPTFNRTPELHICLDGFAHQEGVSNDDFEILIIDDGSTEDVQSVVHQFQGRVNVHLLRTGHGGAGAARNAGLKHARGSLIILYDDDARPTPDLIAYCLDFHRKHPGEEDMALLCFTPDIAFGKSPFERWAFETIYPFPKEPGIYGWSRFWAGTLTLKKSVFRYGEFDPAFPMVEDLELGLRLQDSLGLRIHYEPRSYGTFSRGLTLPQICKRQYTCAYFVYRIVEKRGRPDDFMWKPYHAPQKYVVTDTQRLRTMASIARSFDERRHAEQSKVVTPAIRGLFSALEMHCLATGWITAREGLPLDPAQDLESLLKH